MSFAIRQCSGERIRLEYLVENEIALKRAERAAERARRSLKLPNAALASLALSISGNRVVFEALVLASE